MELTCACAERVNLATTLEVSHYLIGVGADDHAGQGAPVGLDGEA